MSIDSELTIQSIQDAADKEIEKLNEKIKWLESDLSAMKKAFNLANNWRNEHLDDSKKLDKIKELNDRFLFTPAYLIIKIINGEHVCNDTSCNSEDDHEKLDDTLETVEKE
jgi:hypothetical protein